MLPPLALLPLCAAGANLLPNPGFEGPFGPDGLAADWYDNSGWADLDVQYAPEANAPHEGKLCQRITCSRLSYGAVQLIPGGGVPLVRGRIYRVRAWLRGDVGPVAVQLRLAPAPYTVYAERALPVGPEWQRLEYLWAASVDDPQARLMIRFTERGALWVDDVSVEEVTEEEARRSGPALRSGNLLRNGSFDLGPANWLLGHPCDYWTEPSLAIEDTLEGRAMRLEVPAGIGATLASDSVEMAAGHPVQLSVRLRASAPVSVNVHTRHAGVRAEVGSEWQTFTATGVVRWTPLVYDALWISCSGPATLWIAEAQLRQDGQEGGTRPAEAALISDRHPLSLYHDGETPRLLLRGHSADGLSVRWQVRDFWGHSVTSGAQTLAAGRQERTLTLRRLKRGWYHAEVTWMDGDRPCRNESTFCLLPPSGRRGEARLSPFGAHFAVDPTNLRLAQAVGCRWLRLHPPNHTKWRTVEPEANAWAWRDEPIRLAREAAFELVGSLDRCPRWASSAPPGTTDEYYTGFAAWMPRDWSEWEGYVAETVRRHKADIHVWEVWNEANAEDWWIPRPGQSQAEGYVELLQHTTPIVKREDPTATVVAGVVAGALRKRTSAWTFSREVIERGGLEWMDVFSFHDYIQSAVDEGDEPIEVWLARLRDAMRAAGREVPVINSEGGFANPGSALSYRPCDSNVVSADVMARLLVRQHVSQLALGVDRFFFYNFFIDGSPEIRLWEGFVEGDGQPRPNVAAYATLTWLLDGATFNRTERPTTDTWQHWFRTPHGPLAVAWSRTGSETRLTFPRARQAWDLVGAPLQVPRDGALNVTDAPVYVRCGSPSPGAPAGR
jgi:hypothetical protein